MKLKYREINVDQIKENMIIAVSDNRVLIFSRDSDDVLETSSVRLYRVLTSTKNKYSDTYTVEAVNALESNDKSVKTMLFTSSSPTAEVYEYEEQKEPEEQKVKKTIKG